MATMPPPMPAETQAAVEGLKYRDALEDHAVQIHIGETQSRILGEVQDLMRLPGFP